jgi:hypothetical protein
MNYECFIPVVESEAAHHQWCGLPTVVQNGEKIEW